MATYTDLTNGIHLDGIHVIWLAPPTQTMLQTKLTPSSQQQHFCYTAKTAQEWPEEKDKELKAFT